MFRKAERVHGLKNALAASLALLLVAAAPAAMAGAPESPGGSSATEAVPEAQTTTVPPVTGADQEAQPTSAASPSIREVLARSAQDPWSHEARALRPVQADAKDTAASAPETKTKHHHKKAWIIAGIVVGAAVVVAAASGGGGGSGGY